MRDLGFLKTENQMYKITMQEDGFQEVTEPRCPINIYEKDANGGWSHLETIDGEKDGTDKNMAFTNMKSTDQAWHDAIDVIRFYDESDITTERRKA